VEHLLVSSRRRNFQLIIKKKNPYSLIATGADAAQAVTHTHHGSIISGSRLRQKARYITVYSKGKRHYYSSLIYYCHPIQNASSPLSLWEIENMSSLCATINRNNSGWG